MTFHLRMKILLLSLMLLKTCSTFNLRHLSLRTFSQVLATVIKMFQCSILHFKCILILVMGNIKCYHETVFTVCLFKQR